ncbi:MAG TPA: 3'-5' exonuclease [Longimicrobiaceae bacterium]
MLNPDDALARIADTLRATGRYHVAARFRRRSRYAEDDGTPTRRALYVDVETTGLDPARDAIIQLCAAPFDYAPSDGRIFNVGEAVVCYEDPGRPIPLEITALTGITDEVVAGKRLDEERVNALLATTSLVIAHNARFDRPFLERRISLFQDRPWACSRAEVPWEAHGIGSTKLEFILFKLAGEVFEGHRADEDSFAGIHILATPLPSGERPMALLLESCHRRTARIWALDSAYEHRRALKARGYRWSSGEGERPRSWYLDVPEDRADEQLAWLREVVYRGTRPRWRCETFDAHLRYSERVAC